MIVIMGMLGGIGLYVGKRSLLGFRDMDVGEFLKEKDGWEMGFREGRGEVVRKWAGEVGVGEVEGIGLGLGVVFRKVDGGGLLEREGVGSVKRVEEKFRGGRFGEFCWRNGSGGCEGEVGKGCGAPVSVTRDELLYGVWKDGRFCGVEDGVGLVKRDRWEEFLKSDFGGDRRFSSLLPKSFDGKESNMVLTRFMTGVPLRNRGGKVFVNQFSNPKTQEMYLRKFMKEAGEYFWNFGQQHGLTVHVVGNLYEKVFFWTSVKLDIVWVVLAVCVAALAVWLHTCSLFLALFGLLHFLLALPATFCFYRLVFQIQYTSGLHFIPLFALLCIAIIDIFVFTDAWHQAAVVLGPECDIVIRMSWTYRRVAKANLVTSIPAAAAFFAAAFHPLIPLSALAIWTGILTVLQFVLNITMYPCSLIIWHTFWRRRRWSNCLGYEYNFDDPQPEITTVAQFDSHTPWCSMRRHRASSETNHRATELFFRNYWTRWINQSRYLALLIALGLAGAGAFFVTQLSSLDAPERFLRPRNRLERDAQLVKAKFVPEATGNQLKVSIVYGIKGIDRDGIWRYNSEQSGKPLFDEGLDLKSSDAQRQLVKICDKVEKDVELNVDQSQKSKCWPREFLEFLKAEKKCDGKKCKDFKDYKSHNDLVGDLRDFSEARGEKYNSTSNKWVISTGSVGFRYDRDYKKGKVVLTSLEFVTKMSEDAPRAEMEPLHEKWRRKVDLINEESKEMLPKAGLSGGDAWESMKGRRKFARYSKVGIGIALGAIFVALLLSMLNIVMAIYTTIGVGSVIVCAIGFMYLVSENMSSGNGGVGIAESLIITLVSGLSVKNTVLVAHGYLESETKGNRFLRTRDALTYNGISIVSSSLAILASSAPLLGSQISPLFKYAVMVIITTLFSLAWSLFFFPAVLVIAGPENDFGSLIALYNKIIAEPIKRWRTGEPRKTKGEKKEEDRYLPFVFDEVLDKKQRYSEASSWMIHSSEASSCYQPFVFDDAFGCDDVESIRHILYKQSRV